MRSRLVQMSLLLLLTALTACDEPLYSDLSEGDANDMIAVLTAAEIKASRTKDKDGQYTVEVAEHDIGAAVTILKSHSLPRERFSSLGEVFDASGLIGTPFEERARYMYALSQELSETIAGINGIDSARVHVVLPKEDRFAKKAADASASIAIYTREGFDLTAHATTIKQLVAFGVPNLSYDNVVLARFKTGGVSIVRTTPTPGFGSAQAAEQRAVQGGPAMLAGFSTVIPAEGPRRGWFVALIVAGLGAFAVCAVLLWRTFADRQDPGTPPE